MEQTYLDSLKHSTPSMPEFKGYFDADDELKPIAEKLRVSSKHLSEIDPSRVKFFYSSKPKKRGSSYEIFNLMLRNEIEKNIESSYDYVLTVYYAVWKQLDPIQKVIALDKALCGIDLGTGDDIKLGKATPDCSEFKSNMKEFGANEVMNTSEIITLACIRIAEEAKEAKKAAKDAKKEAKENKRANKQGEHA